MTRDQAIISKLIDLKHSAFGIMNLFPSDTDKTVNSLLWHFVSRISEIQKTLEVSDGK